MGSDRCWCGSIMKGEAHNCVATKGRIEEIERERDRYKTALVEVCEALENCDRHVGLLGGERAKLERAQKLLNRTPKQESIA